MYHAWPRRPMATAGVADPPLGSRGRAPAPNFEGAQSSPARISADGTRLFVVNTSDARLAVDEAWA